MNSHIESEHLDIKHEEKTFSLYEVKSEPQDIDCESKREVEGFVHIDIKHEIHQISDLDNSFKTLPDVEDAALKLDRLSQNCEELLQNEQENVEEYISTATPTVLQLCRNNEPNLKERKSGINTEDKKENAYTFNECTNSPFELNDLISNVFTKTADKRLKCSVCSKSYSCKRYFIAHMYIHTGEKPFTCNVCNKSFNCKRNLNAHMYMHTGEKPFTCNICSKSFSEKSKLVVHTRTHTGEKHLTCCFCNKSFFQKSDLSKHMRSHTGEKPFSCNLCSKSFSQKSTLTVHMRTHTGEKPFSCNFCSKTFSQRAPLIIHTRIHSGEKPYSCDICSRSFYQKSTLVHTSIHRV